MNDTGLEYGREARSTATRMLRALLQSGFRPNAYMVDGLRCAAATVENHMADTLAAQLIDQLTDVQVDAAQVCVDCHTPITAHFDNQGRFIGHGPRA